MLYLLTQYLNHTGLFILALFEVLFVVVVNYYFILGKKWAWRSLLIWFILLTFTFEIPLFSWSLSYGFHLSPSFALTLGTIELSLGMGFISFIILIFHYKSKKHITSSLIPLEDLDNIEIEEKAK